MPNDTCVDDAALAKLRDLGGAEFLVKLIDVFLENVPERIGAARAGLRADDLKAVELAAHSLKSSAGSLGATRLRDLAARVEDTAEARRSEGLSALLDELESAFAAVRARLEREKTGLA